MDFFLLQNCIFSNDLLDFILFLILTKDFQPVYCRHIISVGRRREFRMSIVYTYCMSVAHF